MYIPASNSWNESETHCKSFGGHLAAPTSYEELNSTLKLCGERITGCWVGARSLNSTSEFGWNWSDDVSPWNESLVSAGLNRANCVNKSCRVNSSVELCAVVSNRSTSLVVDRCNATHASICMINFGKASHILLMLLVDYETSIHHGDRENLSCLTSSFFFI